MEGDLNLGVGFQKGSGVLNARTPDPFWKPVIGFRSANWVTGIVASRAIALRLDQDWSQPVDCPQGGDDLRLQRGEMVFLEVLTDGIMPLRLGLRPEEAQLLQRGTQLGPAGAQVHGRCLS